MEATVGHLEKVKRIRKVGDFEALKKKLWQAITTTEQIATADNTTNADRIRAIHALTQTAGAYMRLIEMTEQAGKVTELEEELEKLQDLS